MSEWVWRSNFLRILLLTASCCHHLLEVQFLCLWHQEPTAIWRWIPARQRHLFCYRRKPQVLLPDQATDHIFKPLISALIQTTPIREKPA